MVLNPWFRDNTWIYLGPLWVRLDLRLQPHHCNFPFGLMVHNAILGPQKLVWKVWVFPLPQSTISLINGYRSLWGRPGGRLTVYAWDSGAAFFLKGNWTPLQIKGSGPVDWLRFGNWVRGCDSQMHQLKSTFVLPDLVFSCYIHKVIL